MEEASGARSVVERYLGEVLERKDADAGERLISNETLKQKVMAFLVAFPDLEITAHKIVTEGSLVACHLAGAATHRAPFQGIPASGKRWTATCSAFYEVADGRIADAWINWDLLSIMEQIGGVRRTEGASA